MSGQNDLRVIIQNMLRSGVLVAVTSAVGTFTLGPAGTMLGSALGGILAVARYLTATEALAKIASNPIFLLVNRVLKELQLFWSYDRIWEVVKKFTSFVKQIIETAKPIGVKPISY